MSINTGGPAFPRVVEQPNGYMQSVEGMTLRDYFAAKAMQGMLANPEIKNSIFQGAEHGFLEKSAWLIADAMLQERDAETAQDHG